MKAKGLPAGDTTASRDILQTYSGAPARVILQTYSKWLYSASKAFVNAPARDILQTYSK